jgi:hypothetical protein
MKKSKASLGTLIQSVAKSTVGKKYHFTQIEESKGATAFFVVPKAAKKNFAQIISLVLNSDGFVSIEMFVTNLSVTELWAEIQLSNDVVPEYLVEMLKISDEELSKSLKTDAQYEGVLKLIDKHEGKRESLIVKLSALEKKIAGTKVSDSKIVQLSDQLYKVEEDCVNEEINISQLSYRYFVNSLDEIDPFFFSKMTELAWSKKKKK